MDAIDMLGGWTSESHPYTVETAAAICQRQLIVLRTHLNTLKDLSSGINPALVFKQMYEAARTLEQASRIGADLLYEHVHDDHGKEDRE